MGKLTSFYVSFNDNDNAIYNPGQTISGSLFVVLSAPMDMRTIEINFHGQASVHWTAREGSGQEQTTVHYKAKEKYFDQVIYVFGEGSGGHMEEAKQIPVGENVYPFSFQLPINLPSSFEGAVGHVRYTIKATIERPRKFNHNTKIAFTVLDMLDLNLNANLRSPVSSNDSKTLCCLCCTSGPIEAQLHLDKSGYVSGEFIMVNASVNNASLSGMSSTKAALEQQVTYRVPLKSCTRKKKVASVKGPGCRRGGSIEWRNERLQIPALPPSFLQHCGLIIITYKLKFYVVVPSGRNLKVSVPITLGTIPLREPSSNNAAPPDVIAPPIEPTTSSMAASLPGMSKHNDQPPTTHPSPPSYASVAGGSMSIRDG